MFIGNNAILVLDVKKSPGERFGNQFNWLNVTFLNLHMRHTYVLSQVDTDFLECYIPEDLPME